MEYKIARCWCGGEANWANVSMGGIQIQCDECGLQTEIYDPRCEEDCLRVWNSPARLTAEEFETLLAEAAEGTICAMVTNLEDEDCGDCWPCRVKAALSRAEEKGDD